MAATSLLALLDDISTLLDDVATMTKIATKKTAGVLGDDLALNAQQVSGVRADRELPVVWAVAKGSLRNKAILVPAALLISAFAPWLIVPLLMLGGAYLCFEGAEKLHEKWFHTDMTRTDDQDGVRHPARLAMLADPEADLVAFEQDKIRGAIRTDFILSAEIIAISLGAIAGQPFGVQVVSLVVIAIVMTVGVYGLVAGIVKLDDAGLALSQRSDATSQRLGHAILRAAPWLMRALSVAGTAAMFLVGGGIVLHGIAPIHHGVQAAAEAAGNLGWLVEMLANGLGGVLLGAIIVAIVTWVRRIRSRTDPPMP